jgi:LuxR family maltose regulon positive regulatory protein
MLEKNRRARKAPASKRPRASHCTGGSPDVLNAKLRPPAVRPGVVPRPALVNALRRSRARVVKVIAPAGWGKTTLAAQWAAAETRPWIWLSVDAHDNDAVIFLKHVMAGIERVTPLGPPALTARTQRAAAEGQVRLARSAAALRTSTAPVLIVVDNVDLLHTIEATRVLRMLVEDAPSGSTIVLVARVEPIFETAALSERGEVKEVTTIELALSEKDAAAVLRTGDPELAPANTDDVVRRFEGWPAGLYLASLALAEGAAGEPEKLLTGSDRYLADYMRSEYLAQLRPQELRFVERTSILENLNAALCDSVMQRKDSSARLKRLARLQLTIADGETPGERRYPRLLRELLTTELEGNEPLAPAALHRRAADWYLGHGDPDSALDHAQAAEDPARVASLLSEMALAASSSLRMGVVEQAVMSFDALYALDKYPNIAVHGSWIHAFRGRNAAATRWLNSAEAGLRRDSRNVAAISPRIAVVNAALCRRGPRQMLADAGAAMAALAPRSAWYPAALHMRACAALLVGAPDDAQALLAAAVRSPAAGTETRMIALAQLSLLARDRDDPETAERLAAEASALAAKLDGAPTAAIALAAHASAVLRHGSWTDAREDVRAADELCALVTDALPWLAIQIRLELARCYLTMRDHASAQAHVEGIDRLLDARPRVGVLVDRARALRHEISSLPRPETHSGGLTPAELRLLPFLATHLAFREIADELDVSRNTVKTQAISIYRKLGVKSRSEAISAAAGLGVRPAGSA